MTTMDRDTELAVIRRAYAKQVLGSVNVCDSGLEKAFAAVKREDFLGPAPWQVFHLPGGYVSTPDADPVHLYTDRLVAIDPERNINNGQPSLHGYLLAAAAPKAGEHVVHVGTGAGYYTAIMAELVTPSGQVTGIEFDPGLAERAKKNLRPWSHVKVMTGDGAITPFDAADVIYVNAGATQPARAWLDGLRDGGRLILPLTTDKNFGTALDPTKVLQRGAVFKIERKGEDYFAKWISPVAIFPCAGNRDAESEKRLAQALETGNPRQVTRLYRDQAVPQDKMWLSGDGWTLAYQ